MISFLVPGMYDTRNTKVSSGSLEELALNTTSTVLEALRRY